MVFHSFDVENRRRRRRLILNTQIYDHNPAPTFTITLDVAMNKKHNYFKFTVRLFLNSAFLLLLAGALTYAQMPTPSVPRPPAAEDYTWWYVSLFILILGLVGAIGWMMNSKKETVAGKTDGKKGKQDKSEVRDPSASNADQELEWLRKNNGVLNRKSKKNGSKTNFPEGLPQASNIFGGKSVEEAPDPAKLNLPLPVYGFTKLERARPFDFLPISNDEALLSAVEQTHEEYEEDEEIRDLSVRILAAFKTRNSVEALTQVALYDLSSTLRSKAVLTLADFDHESVFEALLLACADPTREVRAAAARGFTRLSFDRADAWMRIAETGEKGRMRHAARAAVEGGFVERVFDRLIHTDPKHVYEAVAFLALLVKAGETEIVFDKLSENRNPEVSRAILHVIKITDEQEVLNELYTLLERKNLAPELRKVIDETIESVGLVAA